MDGCIKAVLVFDDGRMSRTYDKIFCFKGDFAEVKLDNKYGLIDRNGKEIIPPIYERIYEFKDGLAEVCFNGKMGIISLTGQLIIEPKYDSICRFSNGKFKVFLNGKCGIIDYAGVEMLKPHKYNDIADFHDGVARVFVRNENGNRYNGNYGLIDESFNEIVSPKYTSIGNFVEGLAIVSMSGYYGLINKNGEEIVCPKKYTSIGHFCNGLAQVRITIQRKFVDGDGVSHTIDKYLYGIINTQGKEVVEPQYHNISGFDENGIARVVIESERYEAFINRDGVEIKVY